MRSAPKSDPLLIFLVLGGFLPRSDNPNPGAGVAGSNWGCANSGSLDISHEASKKVSRERGNDDMTLDSKRKHAMPAMWPGNVYLACEQDFCLDSEKEMKIWCETHH